MERHLGTLVVERPAPADIAVVDDVVQPPTAAHPVLQLWAWRAVIAVAVLVALIGMIAWSASPPT